MMPPVKVRLHPKKITTKMNKRGNISNNGDGEEGTWQRTGGGRSWWPRKWSWCASFVEVDCLNIFWRRDDTPTDDRASASAKTAILNRARVAT